MVARALCLAFVVAVSGAATALARPPLQSLLAAEEPRLRSAFDVTPVLIAYDDGDTPNAISVGRHTPGGFSASILMGVNFARSELSNPLKGPDALVGILAHEFAHIVQAQRRSALRGRDRELHADFLAGWYCGRRSSRLQDLRAFAVSLWDRATRDAEAFEHAPDTESHGSPQRRVAAMLAGFDLRARALDAAFAAGARWVRHESSRSAGHPERRPTQGEVDAFSNPSADDRVFMLIHALLEAP